MKKKVNSLTAQAKRENSKSFKVSKIKEGTVIDHIPVGVSKILMTLLEDFLKLNEKPQTENIVIQARGVNSNTLPEGKKDIIKIENKELPEEQINIIGIVAPKATISIIRDYKVVDKPRPVVPEEIVGVFPCPDKRSCISNDHSENIEPHLILHTKKPQPKYRCRFCEALFLGENLIKSNY